MDFMAHFRRDYSKIDGIDAIYCRGLAAFILDHALSVVFGGYGFVNNIDFHQQNK